MSAPSELTEHFFRHQSAPLVARLCRRFGAAELVTIEDAVQSAMLEAMLRWRKGPPERPAAWLHRVATNRVIDHLRRRARCETVAEVEALERAVADDPPSLDAEIDARGLDDDVLRLIFVVCHPALSPRAQTMMALKHLCGFAVGEIARGLLMSPEAVKKQLQRAAARLRAVEADFELPSDAELRERLDGVHRVLYLVFNEGYSCTRGEEVIRQDVCAEAARLCHLLSGHRVGTAETRALLALMMLHAARMPARVDGRGDTVLLEDQDRTRWDRSLIDAAAGWLCSAGPDGASRPGRYQLEACIAWLHGTATDFAATPWAEIIGCYDALIRGFDAPAYRLNRAIAVAHLHGLDAARHELEALSVTEHGLPPHGRSCANAWLHERAGDHEAALRACREALATDLAPHEWRLLDAQRSRLEARIDARTAKREA